MIAGVFHHEFQVLKMTTAATPLTRAEATAYRETSLHADVMAFLAALSARSDPRLSTRSLP